MGRTCSSSAAASNATATLAAGETIDLIDLIAIDAIVGGGYDCEPHR